MTVVGGAAQEELKIGQHSHAWGGSDIPRVARSAAWWPKAHAGARPAAHSQAAPAHNAVDTAWQVAGGGGPTQQRLQHGTPPVARAEIDGATLCPAPPAGRLRHCKQAQCPKDTHRPPLRALRGPRSEGWGGRSGTRGRGGRDPPARRLAAPIVSPPPASSAQRAARRSATAPPEMAFPNLFSRRRLARARGTKGARARGRPPRRADHRAAPRTPARLPPLPLRAAPYLLVGVARANCAPYARAPVRAPTRSSRGRAGARFNSPFDSTHNRDS